MGFLKDLLKTYLTDGVRGKLGTQAGTSAQDTDNGVESVITAILAGLQRNVSTREGAASLDKALAKDHDGSILNDLAGVAGGQAAQKDGAKILDHIFGKDKASVQDAVSKKTGLDKEAVMALMIALAPIVLGKLGEMKKNKDMKADEIAKEIEKEKAPSGGLMDNLVGMLDTNKDGSVVDDLLKMGGSMLGGKKS